jgi:hypothetical protein
METMETETKMEKQVMKDFKFTLEKYKGKSTRHTCPGCKLAQCFVRYIDEKGNYIDERVGRCNREDKCGYHLTPSEYLRNKGEYCTPTINVDPKPLPPTDYIPEEMMIKSLRTENNFVKFLAKYFPLPDVAYTIDKYRLGDAKEGKVIYWQIDKENRVRTGKMMLYDVETGHRVKGKPNAFDWVHRHVKNPFQLEQCLFGLHINEDKPIAIVESEKSAVIANLTIPKYTWMATGGKQNFRLMEAVKGLDVTLFPDLGAFEQWHQHASNFGFKISNLLELIATKEEKEKGLDISDFILKQMQK